MPAELGKIERAPGRDLVMLERQFAVQDLNARYAEAIDDDRLEEWPEFFRPDGRYHITTAENLAQGFPIGIVSATSRAMLRDRIVLDGDAATFAEKVVVLDSRLIDTLLAIPL